MKSVKDNIIDLDEILSDFSITKINLDAFSISKNNIFEENRRKAWNTKNEARCDFKVVIRLTRRSGVFFISVWQKSIKGRTLTDIKNDKLMIDYFAINVAKIINQIIGHNLRNGNFCICTTPKRRHKINNFASLISQKIANIIQIPFYEDVAIAHSKQRVNATFTLNLLPQEPNIIIFDDFVTTGQTLLAMKKILTPLGKNLFFFAGINNNI